MMWMFSYRTDICSQLLYFSITAFGLLYIDLGLQYNRLKNKAKQREKRTRFFIFCIYVLVHISFIYATYFQNTSMTPNANILGECLKT